MSPSLDQLNKAVPALCALEKSRQQGYAQAIRDVRFMQMQQLIKDHRLTVILDRLEQENAR